MIFLYILIQQNFLIIHMHGTCLLEYCMLKFYYELNLILYSSFVFHRSLYDDKDQDDFLLSLLGRIKQHEKDIERMCNKNYQVKRLNFLINCVGVVLSDIHVYYKNNF